MCVCVCVCGGGGVSACVRVWYVCVCVCARARACVRRKCVLRIVSKDTILRFINIIVIILIPAVAYGACKPEKISAENPLLSKCFVLFSCYT